MEYLTNRPESTTFSHFIYLFLLFFMLLRSFGIHATIRYERDYPQEIQLFVAADKTLFNEKLWWLDRSKQDQLLICSQRIGVFSEFYEQSPVECTIGHPIGITEKSKLPGADRSAECLSDGQIILCQNPDGTVKRYVVQEEDTNRQRRPRVQFIKS